MRRRTLRAARCIVLAILLVNFPGASPVSAQAPVLALPESELQTPVASPPRRPGLLVPLYLSYGALQVLDVASTERALAGGASEANPLLAGVAGNTGATLAIKAGTTAATVYLVERLWRRNRPAAIILMAALNGAYAAVVAHNYRQAR